MGRDVRVTGAYNTSMNPAIILCERVLCDMAIRPEFLEEPVLHHAGALQTYEIRIQMAAFSGDRDEDLISTALDEVGNEVTLGEAIVEITGRVWGENAATYIQDAICYIQDAIWPADEDER